MLCHVAFGFIAISANICPTEGAEREVRRDVFGTAVISSPMAVVVGLLWNPGVLCPNLATLEAWRFGVQGKTTKRLGLTFGSNLCLRTTVVTLETTVFATLRTEKNVSGAT